MHLSLISSFVAFALAGITNAAPATAASDPTVLPASKDPFYVAPSNVGSYAPGQVIRSRAVSSQLNSIIGAYPVVTVASSTQFMYRTTDSLGNAVATTMTLLVPHNADPTKLWTHSSAYDSNSLDCLPSYSLRAGANNTALADIIFIAAALNKGYYVAVPDFQGLQSQFGAGPLAGHAVLDSVRAALASGPKYGLSTNPQKSIYGYSGGAIGAEWAIELQPEYAPELKFVGAAIGGLIPNFKDALNTMNKGEPSGLNFAGMVGLANAYPDFKKLLNQQLIPSKRSEFMSIASGCLVDIVAAGAFKDVFSYLYAGPAFLLDPVAQATMKAAGLAGQHGTPTMPLFFFEAVADEIAPSADTDALVQTLCKKGALVEYRRNYVGEHISEALTESPEAFQWLADRLAGKPLPYATCNTQNVFVNSFNSSQYPALADIYVSILEVTFAGGNLGFNLSG